MEKKFKDDVSALQAQYKKLMEDKEKDEKEVKDSGLGLAKAVTPQKNCRKYKIYHICNNAKLLLRRALYQF